MLRARIDCGVNLRPWTVTSGWSAGGGFAVCAQPKLTLGPKTAAAVITMTCITRVILSFMVASALVNQDSHCTPCILESTPAHAYTCMSRPSRPISPVNSDQSNALTAASASAPNASMVHGPHPGRVVGDSDVIPSVTRHLEMRTTNLSDYSGGVRASECGFSHLTGPDSHTVESRGDAVV